MTEAKGARESQFENATLSFRHQFRIGSSVSTRMRVRGKHIRGIEGQENFRVPDERFNLW